MHLPLTIIEKLFISENMIVSINGSWNIGNSAKLYFGTRVVPLNGTLEHW